MIKHLKDSRHWQEALIITDVIAANADERAGQASKYMIVSTCSGEVTLEVTFLINQAF